MMAQYSSSDSDPPCPGGIDVCTKSKTSAAVANLFFRNFAFAGGSSGKAFAPTTAGAPDPCPESPWHDAQWCE